MHGNTVPAVLQAFDDRDRRYDGNAQPVKGNAVDGAEWNFKLVGAGPRQSARNHCTGGRRHGNAASIVPERRQYAGRQFRQLRQTVAGNGNASAPVEFGRLFDNVGIDSLQQFAHRAIEL